ncbi:MAG: regulatory protein ArsR [Firmicutes bacterium]|nr:regulatory protein ArsR [Bacillota bacterium]
MIDTIKISKVLGDPIRHKILLMLVGHSEQPGFCCSIPDGGICNCEIMAAFGMIQSRVSYHMKELVDAGLVREVPEGKWKYYYLNADVLKEYIKQLEHDFKL